jgi:DNA-binding Lrp family transcriptional regulator
VLEAHTITGDGDLLCRVVARDNTDLQRVIDQVVAYEGIARGDHEHRAGRSRSPTGRCPLVRGEARRARRVARRRGRVARRAGDGASP